MVTNRTVSAGLPRKEFRRQGFERLAHVVGPPRRCGQSIELGLKVQPGRHLSDRRVQDGMGEPRDRLEVGSNRHFEFGGRAIRTWIDLKVDDPNRERRARIT